MNRGAKDIVIVSDVAHVNGGGSQVALSSAVGLAQAGCNVTVFAATPPIMPELLSMPNVQVILTGQHQIANDPSRLRAATQGLWNASAARAFASTLKSIDRKRAIIHVHSWTKALSPSVLNVAINSQIPTVVTLHDYFMACPIGSFYNHKRQHICRLTPLSLSCVTEDCDPRNYRDKLWRVARQAVQLSVGSIPSGIRHYITISDLSQSVLQSLLPSTAQFHRVDNPISVEKGPKVDVSRNDVFLYVGRLSPEKGAVVFARAALKAGVRARFVGDGECAAEIARVNPSVEISGWLPQSDVLAELSLARSLVFPSLWYENSPLAVVEAAARGVPAIVADSCAARERVADGYTGKHFRSGSTEDLAKQLQLFTNGALAAVIGGNAYTEYWSAPCHVGRHVLALDDVYEAMLRDAA